MILSVILYYSFHNCLRVFPENMARFLDTQNAHIEIHNHLKLYKCLAKAKAVFKIMSCLFRINGKLHFTVFTVMTQMHTNIK